MISSYHLLRRRPVRKYEHSNTFQPQARNLVCPLRTVRTRVNILVSDMHTSYYTLVAIALKVVPMISGLASLISSTTINIMIFRSSKKLADPYRRLIFGISCFDILQSLSHTLSIFKSNPDELSSWLALGNQTSCQVLGFFHFAGHNGSLFYNLSLNIFYLCLVKYNVKKDCYRHRIEPFLHGLPVAWSIISSSKWQSSDLD